MIDITDQLKDNGDLQSRVFWLNQTGTSIKQYGLGTKVYVCQKASSAFDL